MAFTTVCTLMILNFTFLLNMGSNPLLSLRINAWPIWRVGWQTTLSNETRTKSELILFGPRRCGVDLNDKLPLLPGGKTLGVIFDTELRIDRQINAVVKKYLQQSWSPSSLLMIWRRVCMILSLLGLDSCNAFYLLPQDWFLYIVCRFHTESSITCCYIYIYLRLFMV